MRKQLISAGDTWLLPYWMGSIRLIVHLKNRTINRINILTTQATVMDTTKSLKFKFENRPIPLYVTPLLFSAWDKTIMKMEKTNNQ